jgi:hypothetical protein
MFEILNLCSNSVRFDIAHFCTYFGLRSKLFHLDFFIIFVFRQNLITFLVFSRKTLLKGTFHVKTPKDFQVFHHGSENLNQIFSTDSPIKLKLRFRTSKLSKTKTRIFAAYCSFRVFRKTAY